MFLGNLNLILNRMTRKGHTMDEITDKSKDSIVSAPPDTVWHLDKRIPIALLIALLAQVVTGVYYIARLESRVNIVELWLADQRTRDDRQDRVMEQAIITLRQDINYVRSQLDTLLRDSANNRR